jgi:hypothetical protein
MSNRTHRWAAALALAATLTTLLAAPGLPRPAAAASCTAWTSETQPPPAIRVYRSALGAVETVDFRAYVKNVLSREWISSWTTESIRAGALAVRGYAWYQVLHYRGYVTASGACFDVFDTTRDQVYDPTRPVYGPMAAAVDATWATLVLKAGHVFPAYYNAGAAGEACGANVNGWKLYQWGSQACGLGGRTAAQILGLYYAGITVSAAPPPATPPPSPTPVPTPTPQPTTAPTATFVASPSPTPSPSATTTPPAPTPVPTPVPTAVPTPPPTAPPPALPGGGQSGVVNAAVPPPPPLPDPVPIVVTPRSAEPATAEAVAALPAHAVWQRSADAMRRVLEWPERTRRMGASWPSDVLPARGVAGLDARLVAFRVLIDRLATRLADQLTAAILGGGTIALAMPAPR